MQVQRYKDAKVQRRCRGGAEEVQRWWCREGAEVQRWCRGGAELVCRVQRCWCRGGAEEVGAGAKVQRLLYRGGADVQRLLCRGGTSCRGGIRCRGCAEVVVQSGWCSVQRSRGGGAEVELSLSRS